MEKDNSLIIKNLEENLAKNKYVLKDLVVPVKDNVKKIDYVVVTKAGICLIFLEEFNGKISGNQKDTTWKKVQNRKSIEIPNPILEKSEVEEILDSIFISINKTKYKTFLVYNDDTNITKVEVTKRDYVVTKLSNIQEEIEKYCRSKAKAFDAAAMYKVYGYLKSYSNLTLDEKKEHLQRVSKKKYVETAGIKKVVIDTESEKKYLKHARAITEEERKKKYEELNNKSLELLNFSLLGLLMLFISVFVIIISLNLKLVWIFLILSLICVIIAIAFSYVILEIKRKSEEINSIKILGRCPYCDSEQEIKYKKLVYSCKKCSNLYYIDETK